MFVGRQIFHFQPYCSYSKSSYQNRQHIPLIEIQHHLGDFYRCSKLSSFQVLQVDGKFQFFAIGGQRLKIGNYQFYLNCTQF